MARDIIELIPLLDDTKKIVITTHAKPDGDAMGSSLALYDILVQLKHNVNIVVPTDYPDFLYWLPGNDKVIIYPEQKKQSDELISEAELIFCLDFNHLSRIKGMQDSVKNSSAIKIMVDHHLNPSDFDSYRLSRTSASSTAELIYELYELLHDKIVLNKDIAACIYTGIMTDTGSFRFDCTTAQVHRIIANLIETGIKAAEIHNYVYDSFNENRLRLLGYILSEKMVILEEYNAAYISLSKEDLTRFNVKTGDTEGIVNYPLGIRGIRIAVMITDRSSEKSDENEIRLSLRSIGDISVSDMSNKYFNGGGHKNAAGGMVKTSIEDAIERFKKALSEM